VATLYQKVEIFDIFGAAFPPPPVAIEVKFCTAKRTYVPVRPAKFDMNRCNESPLRGEKPDFWSVSKFNTGSLPLCGILPVNQERTQDWRKATAQYLCLAHATSYWNVSSSIVSLLKSRNCLVPNKPGS